MNQSYSTEAFEQAYTYTGADLGASWSAEKTHFRLWAPTAQAVSILFYRSGTPWENDFLHRIDMQPDVQGTWTARADGDLYGLYYTYLVTVEGKTQEACDPYAKAVGVNGMRAMILDLHSTDPIGWETDRDPNYDLPFQDSILYETHIRDFTINVQSGIRNKGKYLGLSETGTMNKKKYPTGLDHLKALGITHLHLLPFYDFGSVDEANTGKAQYNWGYDPVNYNVPEGSYSTDPYHGEVRIRELKQMIKALHDNGISIVMDVVYNHVYHTMDFCFNQIVPGYFSRFDEKGRFSNGSFCGNETATERSMVRKYIIDSVNYWADEYHIDGFRFDIASLIDLQTMQDLIASVHTKHPNVIFYGEGWHMDAKPTKPDVFLTEQQQSWQLSEFAFFNDSIRDTLRGPMFDWGAPGFVSGNTDCRNALSRCFLGITDWTDQPEKIINYISCHDNHTLFDRISMLNVDEEKAMRARRNNLAAAFNLLAQGIPFFQAGEELLRSKKKRSGIYEHNSYRSSDAVNAIRWDQLSDSIVQDTLSYYQGLIGLRKRYPVFRMRNRQAIRNQIERLEHPDPLTVAFALYDQDYRILTIFHAAKHPTVFPLPQGSWQIHALDQTASVFSLGTTSGKIEIPPVSTLVLVQTKDML